MAVIACCAACVAWAGGTTTTPGEAEVLKSYGSPLAISPSAMRSVGTNPEALYLIPNTGVLQAQEELAYAVAPVYLPDGATIHSLHAVVFDGWDGPSGACSDVAGLDVGVWLMRVQSYTGETQQMSFLQSSGSDSSNQWLYDGSVDYPVVDDPYWTYYLVVRMCKTAHYFMGADVLYVMP
jgi:hypothetical protein